ncbi:polysaccharide biosynthesis tyrosine autokinase [Yaniella flava]|uniref:non-specific protein-tyrosine kinase n=1 Tax=Yaniella flava TaxID=287930 RepID=A0ABP5GFQ9_9MICC
MELRDYLRIFYANWVLIVVTTLVGVAAAAGFTFLATPQYEAQSKLYISVQTDSQASGDLLQGSNFAQQNMATFAELATTESVLEPVAEELSLDLSRNQLTELVNVAAPADSTLLNVTVSNEDPELAAQISNEIGVQLKTLVEEELEPPQGDDETSPVQVNMVQSAQVPTSPVSPRLPLNLALGFLLGLAVGVGIAVLRAVLDTRIRSVHDIEQITEAPVLGRIADDPDASKKPLIVHLESKSPRAEAFRALRTNLQFLTTGEGSKTFVISSAGPGEGKSTTATNLALALAETGMKVALVDCDLRWPRVAQYMDIEGAVGLTDVLIGRADISDVLQRWGRSQLYILPAGKVPPNPSELLGSDLMEHTLDVLSNHVDIILLDSPPLLAVTDAAVIGSMTQGVVLVTAADSTRKQELESAVSTLDTAGVALRGIVATMLPTKGPGRYGYGQYMYGYGEDDVLPDDQQRRAPKKSSGRRASNLNRG